MSSTTVFPRFDPFADLSADVDEKASTLSLPYCDACHSAHQVSEPSISLVDCCCSTLSQSCLAAYINHYVATRKSVSSIPCPQPACGKELTTAIIQSILAPAEFEAYLHATLVAFIEQDQHSFICPNDACKAVISIAPFNPPPIPDPIPEKDEDGRVLTAEAWLHFCEYRVRCRECNLIFCASCKTTPYHKGYTCSAYKDYQSARHCRFCTQRLDGSNQHRHASNSIALKDVCTEEECVKKAELSCERMLACGCPCQGIKGETNCLPCLKHDLEIASDYCSICYVEELGAAPCIKMTGPCLHVFHYQCALTKISSKWPGARISFEFRTCPVCKQNMAHPALESVLAPVIAMESGIIEKALQRLKYEGRENEAAIAQKGGEFYQNAVGFAMKNYLFYQCFKCQRPYFAGGYQCVDASVQGFDPSELICPSCQPSSVEDCGVHGKDWLAYKCRYCCSFANWYCIAEGTLVALADGGSVPIEKVQVGHAVLSYYAALAPGETEGLVMRQVDAVMDQGSRACVELLLSDGRILVCTPDHRIRTADGRWVEAGKLMVGTDEVAVGVEYPHSTAGVEGADAKVLPLFRVRLMGRRDVGVKHVYDLSVPSPQGEESRSFVANGVVVHNCWGNTHFCDKVTASFVQRCGARAA